MTFQWCTNTNLELNVKMRNHDIPIKHISYDYVFNNEILQGPANFTDLGNTFDQSLIFNYHIDATVSSAFQAYGFFMRNSRDFHNVKTLKTLDYSIVKSKLEYASINWRITLRPPACHKKLITTPPHSAY